jgi:hypothetical protein
MEHDTVAKIAASLKEGIVPPAQPRDIEAAVQLIVDELPHTPVEASTRIRRARPLPALVIPPRLHFYQDIISSPSTMRQASPDR